MEKRLKDYKGFQVWKITDNYKLKSEKTIYMLNDNNDDNINCFSSLSDLKKYTDKIK